MRKMDKNTVVIERSDRSVEGISRSRVVLAPERKIREEIEQTLRAEQLPVDGKLTTEATNLEDISQKVAATKQTDNETEEHQPTKDAASKNQKEESEYETEEFVIDYIVANKVKKSEVIDMPRKAKRYSEYVGIDTNPTTTRGNQSGTFRGARY